MAGLTLRPTYIGTAADIVAETGSIGEGALAYATDTNQAYRFDGSAWQTETDADTVATNLATVVTNLATTDTYRPVVHTLTSDSADIQDNTFVGGLTVTLPIAGSYLVEALIYYTTAAAADLQLQFVAGTATITGTVGTSDISLVAATAVTGTTTSRVPAIIGTSWTTAISILSDQAHADLTPLLFKGKIVATVAGSFQLWYAQVSTTASNTHLGAGSYLQVQRFA